MVSATNVYTAGKVLFNVAPALIKALVRPPSWDDVESVGQHLQETAELYPDHPAITFEGDTISWQQFNERVNQTANVMKPGGNIYEHLNSGFYERIMAGTAGF
jgi:hypothetical protein